MKDGANQNSKQKGACPGARGEWIANTWALNWLLGFPAVVAKGSTSNLQCFYSLNNRKQLYSLRGELSRKQILAGINSMGPCTRYCWGSASKQKPCLHCAFVEEK